VKRCFDAMNDFNKKDGRDNLDTSEKSSWKQLEEAHGINEGAYCRNVGLVFETRPDWIDEEEVKMLRRLGATKIQIGIQSLDNKILKANKRGHTIKETKRAFELLRKAGFKIHAHWMPNLYMSTVKKDKRDYLKLWKRDFRPDELKIYPTSLIPNTELEELFKEGKYVPYGEDELKNVLRFCLLNTPRYCRLTRVVRDIPAQEILEGNKKSNMRQIVENDLKRDGLVVEDIRAREIRGKSVEFEDLELEIIEYLPCVSKEFFISYKTKTDDKICGFLRLSVPKKRENYIDELSNSTIIREVHVYGSVVGIGKKKRGRSQHLGLGKRMVKIAEGISKENGFKKICVISAIGTRRYYEKLGFSKVGLYMQKEA
jgi:elongator complex protein 3